MKNTNFGKLISNSIEYAPSILVTKTSIIYIPTESDYLVEGWKKIVNSQPTEPVEEGKHWEQDTWVEAETTITMTWKIVDDPVVYKSYKVPDLFFWLRIYDSTHTEVQKGQAVIDWLDSNNLNTIAVTTRIVSENNELFFPTLIAIKEAVGFTDTEIQEALAYAETNEEPD